MQKIIKIFLFLLTSLAITIYQQDVFAIDEIDYISAHKAIDHIANQWLFDTGFVAKLAEMQEKYYWDKDINLFLADVRHYASDILYNIKIWEFDRYLWYKYYLKGNNVYFDRYKVQSADAQSFQALRERYWKDKRCVYFDMNCQWILNDEKKNEKESAFIFISNFYSKFWSEIYWKKTKIADLKNWEFQDLWDGYININNQIFFAWKPIERDIASFKNFGGWYTSDISGIYYVNDKVSYDKESFEYLWNNYVKDKRGLYYFNKKLEKIDADTVKVLDQHYVIDNKYVLFDNKVIKWVDVDSFEVLEYPWAKDKNNVYEKGILVYWLMPRKFEVIDSMNWLIKDWNGVYENGRRIDWTFSAKVRNYILRVWTKLFYN